MPAISPRKFTNQYDLDLIIASNAGIAIGDLVWDAVGITPPKFDRPGAPRNVFNALDRLGVILAAEREALQSQAEQLPLVTGALADVSVHVDAEHAGDFRYPLLVDVTTKMSTSSLSSFSFGDIHVRRMSNGMRMIVDRLLESVRNSDWHEYDISIRRSFIITELYYGGITVSIDRKIAAAGDINLLTGLGFKLAGRDASTRVETYVMTTASVPFAMRTERLRRFAA